MPLSAIGRKMSLVFSERINTEQQIERRRIEPRRRGEKTVSIVVNKQVCDRRWS